MRQTSDQPHFTDEETKIREVKTMPEPPSKRTAVLRFKKRDSIPLGVAESRGKPLIYMTPSLTSHFIDTENDSEE